jgi:uncharacterized repeat protein (TIGR03803 family)
MPRKPLSRGLNSILLPSFVLILLVTSAYAGTEKQLHSFLSNGKDGNFPYAGVVMDTEGNLYGTTYQGGASRYGVVFELSPPASGHTIWTEKVLHAFTDNGTDGLNPYAALVRDTKGNLYGTTFNGGSQAVGTVFELSPKTGGGWTYKILHSFVDSGTDGQYPYAALILDSAGNLYGTTTEGGVNLDGTVFELSPPAAGSKVWTETLLHMFDPDADDGSAPYASVVFDKTGNLYGTTYGGGLYGYGTVFELTLSSGVWTETVLHNFGNGNDGQNPLASLVLDASGDLYGTTLGGGKFPGMLFELLPPKAGHDVWTEKVIHNFGANLKESYEPRAGVIFDGSGNLYGTASEGGGVAGEAFEFSPKSGGGWTETILHKFIAATGHDGYFPRCNLILDGAGNLYGTTSAGGVDGNGTVFEIIP